MAQQNFEHIFFFNFLTLTLTNLNLEVRNNFLIDIMGLGVVPISSKHQVSENFFRVILVRV